MILMNLCAGQEERCRQNRLVEMGRREGGMN